uniref:Nucleosome assembly protein n=1 Tax=Homalodisca liturata TaxID=320908 RepID=A0A1B6J3S8_9HEMI
MPLRDVEPRKCDLDNTNYDLLKIEQKRKIQTLFSIVLDNKNIVNSSIKELENYIAAYKNLKNLLYKERSNVITRIPNFWITTFINHPDISYLFNKDVIECFLYLSEFQVEEIESDEFKLKIHFFFNENPFIANHVLSKKFSIENDNYTSQNTEINWMGGKKPLRNVRSKFTLLGDKNLKQESFFDWYVSNTSLMDSIIIKSLKEIWEYPMPYYVSNDIVTDS